jgi:hypothetical protein
MASLPDRANSLISFVIEAPYFTLVAASRNDDHGGNTLYRTQIFIDSFLEQCERHQLRAELILVEWNPPWNRAPLAEVIGWENQNPWVDCRVITVPYERHALIRFGRVLPLFQMIAKNVGIRRARGEFILATNIDILFSNELMALVALKAFRADRFYRCDRFDVDSAVPKDAPLDEKLQFAWNNLIQRNHRSGLPDVLAPQIEGAPLHVALQAALASGHFEWETEKGLSVLTAKASMPLIGLHLNACGDFTLMHRDGWAKIGGYPEFEMYSFHIDSIGAVTAHLSGFRESWLPPPAVCFHIEHAVGSGFDGKNQSSLFERLEQQGISWFDYRVIEPLMDEIWEKRGIEFNTEAWGLRDIPLEETVCTRERIEVLKVPETLQADRYAPVTAIRPEWNADQPFRIALRRLEVKNQVLDRERADMVEIIREMVELPTWSKSWEGDKLPSVCELNFYGCAPEKADTPPSGIFRITDPRDHVAMPFLPMGNGASGVHQILLDMELPSLERDYGTARFLVQDQEFRALYERASISERTVEFTIPVRNAVRAFRVVFLPNGRGFIVLPVRLRLRG